MLLGTFIPRKRIETFKTTLLKMNCILLAPDLYFITQIPDWNSARRTKIIEAVVSCGSKADVAGAAVEEKQF